MIAVDSWKKGDWGDHSYYGTDYLHYWGHNAPVEIAWARQKANQTRAQNMIGQRSAIKSRKNDAFQQFQKSSTLANSATILDFLEGNFINNIPSLSEQALTTGNAANIDLKVIESSLKNLKTQMGNFQTFANGLSNIINQIFSTPNQQRWLAAYTQDIVTKAANSKGVMGLGGSKGSKNTKLANGILRSVLNQQNQKVFKIKQNNQLEADAALGKILALINTLPNVTARSSSYRTSKGKKKKNLKGQSQLIEALYDKVYGLFLQIKNVSTEASLAAGYNLANSYTLDKILNGIHVERTAGGPIETSWKPDNKLKREIELAKLEVDKYTTRLAKADVGMYIDWNPETGQGKTTTYAGLTVKDYNGVRFDGETGLQSANGTIDLQEGTSLLVALGRDAEMKSYERKRFAQLAVAHGDASESSEYDTIWLDMLNYISERMFLNVVAGLRRSNESALFIVINGKIFTIENLLSSFINSKDSSIYMNQLEGKAAGLQRQTYVDMSEWLSSDKHGESPNPILAQARSRKLYREVLSVWGATKLKISLNMVQMAGLAQKNM